MGVLVASIAMRAIVLEKLSYFSMPGKRSSEMCILCCGFGMSVAELSGMLLLVANVDELLSGVDSDSATAV